MPRQVANASCFANWIRREKVNYSTYKLLDQMNNAINQIAATQVSMMQMLASIITEENILMATTADLKTKADAVLAQVTADTNVDNAVLTVVNSIVAQMTDLKTQLDAAIAANDPAAVQAVSDQLDAILAADTANGSIVSAAVTAGTPVAPTP